ncbi:MAG TPA: hypothetical protein VGL23_05755 [Chloroflexota bacterium]|jgi:hypothetical protein
MAARRADVPGKRRPAESPPERFRVSRARLTYVFERYAIRDELMTVSEASARLGTTRERIALMVLQGRLAVAEPVGGAPEGRPARMLLRREVEGLMDRPLPLGGAE